MAKIGICYYITMSQQYGVGSFKKLIPGDIYCLCDVGDTIRQ